MSRRGLHHVPSPSLRVALLLLTGCLLLGSCGCGDGLKTYPVRGQVVFPDGSPLPGGIVELEAQAPEAKNLNARGTIQPSGTFVLGTHKLEDGAVAGEHRVLIIPPPVSEEALAKGARPLIDSRFRRYETSGLTCTVRPGDNTVEFKVRKPSQ